MYQYPQTLNEPQDSNEQFNKLSKIIPAKRSTSPLSQPVKKTPVTPSNTVIDISGEILQANLSLPSSQLILQTRRCINQRRYPNPCTACIAKKSTECRFKDLRATKGTFEIENYGPYFMGTDKEDGLQGTFQPSQTATESMAGYTLQKISSTVMDILATDTRHGLESQHSIRRPPLMGVRHICDYCMTSIMNLHWLCAICGKELCSECYHTNVAFKKGGNATRCTYRRQHVKEHLVSIVKYKKESLQTIAQQAQEQNQSNQYPCIQAPTSTSPPYPKISNGPSHTSASIKDTLTKKGVLYLSSNEVTLEMFQRHWAKGQPIVISNTMANSQLTWSPDYFIEHYDQEEIEVIDCTTGKTSLSTVRAYFDSFKSYGQQLRNKNKNAAGKSIKTTKKGEPECILKIKDWPPKQDFSTHSPALYKDFMEMLSVKDYCTANGYMNLANRLPKEYVPSDLGPKMFIAYGSTQGVQGTGTTNLHCDMADAVNVMCYADITDEHASAIWDIYAYKDMAKIETFLVKIAAERKRNIISPIHNQWLYLNDELRQRLYKEYGIKSWRILQNPGDAVYIPAGCAHQVSNYHSAIKCAYDFVSPENVDRCARITRQFSSIKHSDTLQLKNILLFAWKKVYNDWKFLSEKKVIKADYMKEEEEPAVLL